MNTTFPPSDPNALRVECVCAHGFREVEVFELRLKPGSTVFEALQMAFSQGLVLHLEGAKEDAQLEAEISSCPSGPSSLSGLLSPSLLHAQIQTLLEASKLFLSLWGEPCALEQVLEDHTRLEITKALRVDPKIARRERFKKQGAKAAGLFAKQRAGGKAGY